MRDPFDWTDIPQAAADALPAEMQAQYRESRYHEHRWFPLFQAPRDSREILLLIRVKRPKHAAGQSSAVVGWRSGVLKEGKPSYHTTWIGMHFDLEEIIAWMPLPGDENGDPIYHLAEDQEGEKVWAVAPWEENEPLVIRP